MHSAFRIGLVAGVFAIAIALLQQAQNGRYQYSTDGTHGIIVDTRTGDYWTDDGSHFEPRAAHITVHIPSVDDQRASDDRSSKFKECLEANIAAIRAHSGTRRDCVSERNTGDRPEAEPTKPDSSKQ